MSFVTNKKEERNNAYVSRFKDLQHQATGFQNPADDFASLPLDLNEKLIRTPTATYFLRAADNRLTSQGIGEGDLLIVDRSFPPAAGRIAVIVQDDELKVTQLNPQLMQTFKDGVEFWGVITTVIKQLI